MKSSLTILALILGLKANAQLITAVEPIIHNQAYCVHSRLYLNGNLINTSGIYVIKGMADTVWIFGCGYGDTTDLNVYRDTTLVTSLQQDIRSVDSVIDIFGMSHIRPQIIVPHFHLDHINAEFVDGIDSIIGFMQGRIYVHASDYTRCTCNQLCCNGVMCAQGSSYFGAPYHRPWLQPRLALFRILGSRNQPCGAIIKKFGTIYGGWKVVKASPAHTAGCINLDCDSLDIRISGSDINGTCLPPVGWDLLPIHGDCDVDSVYSM